MRTLILLSMIALLGGCATTGGPSSYVEPADAGSAFIELSFDRESQFVWTSTRAVTIDGKFAETSLWSGLPKDKLPVAPGVRKIDVAITHQQGYGNAPWQGSGTLTADLAKGASYKLRTELQGIRAVVSLVDGQGTAVGQPITLSLGQGAAADTMIVPIVMPK